MRVPAVPAVAQNLELLWIPAPPKPSAAPEETPQQTPRASTPSVRSAPSAPSPGPQQNPLPPESNAIAPPIDWQAELAREAQASASSKSEPRFKDFGFPRRALPAAKAPEFAWDRNHTHRVESGAGALVVHLNDYCSFVLTASELAPACRAALTPFPFCFSIDRIEERDH
jgi:hypothetical protein